MRNKIIDKTMGKCAYCGECIKGSATVDHIIPKSIFDHTVFYKVGIPYFLTHLVVGQAENEDNLFAACKTCNEYKSDFSIEVFRGLISKSLHRLQSKSIEYRVAKRFGLLQEKQAVKIEFFFEKLFSEKTNED